MTKHDLENLKNLKKTGNTIRRWLDDKRLASLHDLTSFGELKLLRDKNGHAGDIACLMEPELKKIEEAYMAAFDSKTLTLAQRDDIEFAVACAAETFFSLGLILGADVAEPTGKVSDRLINGWMMSRLADSFRFDPPSERKPPAKRPQAIGKRAR